MAVTTTVWKKNGTGYWIKGDPITATAAEVPNRTDDEDTQTVHGAAPPENVMRGHDFPKPKR